LFCKAKNFNCFGALLFISWFLLAKTWHQRQQAILFIYNYKLVFALQKLGCLQALALSAKGILDIISSLKPRIKLR